MTPQRIQRKRTKGWRMPEGAVYVGRPGHWGNPYRIGEPYRLTDYNAGVYGETLEVGVVSNRAHAVLLFKRFLVMRPGLLPAIRDHLAGHDLACWCPLDQPCHADVLLELANRTTTPEGAS